MLTKTYKPLSVFPAFDSLLSEMLDSSLSLRSNSIGVETKVNEDGSASFSVDLPGVKQDNLSVEVTDSVVTVSAERKTKTSAYTYNKSFNLSEKYDPTTLVAELEDGVLTLTVQPVKSTDKSPRKVEVVSRSSW